MDSLHEEVINEFVIEVGGSSSSEDNDRSDGVSSDSSSVSSDSDQEECFNGEAKEP